MGSTGIEGQEEENMNKSWLAAGLLVAVLTMATASGSWAVERKIDLSPNPAPWTLGQILQVPNGDEEVLYFHIDELNPGNAYTVTGWQLSWLVTNTGSATMTILDDYVQPNTQFISSQWYPLARVRLDGEIDTLVDISAIVSLTQEQGGDYYTNVVTKQIVPEPATLTVLAAGIGGVLVRRRKA